MGKLLCEKIYGTFGVEMRSYGQKLVKLCTHTHTHTHTRVSYSSIDNTFIYIAPYPAGCSWRLTTQYIIVINIKVKDNENINN